MPRRLIRPSWYRDHSHVWAYLFLALVAFAALAREEQLRGREADHFRGQTSAITKQSMDLCRASNTGRVEGNLRAVALKRSLVLDASILGDAADANRATNPVGARSLQHRADEFQHLADSLTVLPPIDCSI